MQSKVVYIRLKCIPSQTLHKQKLCAPGCPMLLKILQNTKLPHIFSICPTKVKILLLQYCELKIKYVVEALTAVLNGI
jgi:hypothetical protein